ncbi:uncharacterized protein LOC115599325 isoform X4 [Calypte anna]|uniref:uncharacterized protein LOC115599325 isoform X4 n=1 Tax=Calypte anna TaxID=9244 RepID=UPI0011C450EE|nr:uncharacterized protein LOC115599325 isoform X4 [Calypte anna]
MSAPPSFHCQAGAPMGADVPLTTGGVLRLREGRGPCTDTSPHLTSFCQVLETILRKGLRQPTWGFRRRDYWHWLEQLPVGDGSRPTPLSTSIQQAGSCREVLTAQGRGRHFLRLALQEKLLEEAVRQLARTPRLLEFYDPVSSILGNETLLGKTTVSLRTFPLTASGGDRDGFLSRLAELQLLG